MLYTCFLDALPGDYEVEVWRLAGKTDLGKESIMRTIHERFRHVPKSRKDGAHDHVLFGVNAGGHAGRVERNGRNDAGGGRSRGRGGQRWQKLYVHEQEI